MSTVWSSHSESRYLLEKNKSYIHPKPCARMLLSVFFGIAKIWRQSNVHQQDKQAVAYPYNGIYSAIKRNELLIHTTTWMSLKTIMLSERVSQKRIYTILSPLSKTQGKCKLIYSDRRQISNCLGKDGWKGQVDRITKVHTATLGGNNTFIHWIVVMVLGVHEYLVCVCAHTHTWSCLTLLPHRL